MLEKDFSDDEEEHSESAKRPACCLLGEFTNIPSFIGLLVDGSLGWYLYGTSNVLWLPGTIDVEFDNIHAPVFKYQQVESVWLR